MKDNNNIPDIDEDISKTLDSTYGFNIGFAVEENRDEVKKYIIRTLNIDNSLGDNIDGIIDQKVEEYAEYKAGVEKRVQNTPKIHD